MKRVPVSAIIILGLFLAFAITAIGIPSEMTGDLRMADQSPAAVLAESISIEPTTSPFECIPPYSEQKLSSDKSNLLHTGHHLYARLVGKLRSREPRQTSASLFVSADPVFSQRNRSSLILIWQRPRLQTQKSLQIFDLLRAIILLH